jgi:hypothetical protein
MRYILMAHGSDALPDLQSFSTYPEHSVALSTLDPGWIRIKEFKNFLPKKLIKNKIRDVHPESRILDLDFSPSQIRIPDPGVKKAPDSGTRSTTLSRSVQMMRIQMSKTATRQGALRYLYWE